MTQPLESLKIGRYTVSQHSPVRVKGKQGIWHIVSISQRPGCDTAAVEVVHTVTAKSRVFDSSLLIYVTPSSKKSRLAESHRDNTRAVTKALVPNKPIGRRAPRRSQKTT